MESKGKVHYHGDPACFHFSSSPYKKKMDRKMLRYCPGHSILFLRCTFICSFVLDAIYDTQRNEGKYKLPYYFSLMPDLFPPTLCIPFKEKKKQSDTY